MLSIGGLNPSAANITAAQNDKDPFWEGVKVFDLKELQWTNYYNTTAAPYLAPSAVAAHYAAGSRYLSAWGSKNLENLFLNSASNSSTPIGSSPQFGRPGRTNHSAAVVGGAIGVVAFLAFVSLAFYLHARTAKRTEEKICEVEESRLPTAYKYGEPAAIAGGAQAWRRVLHVGDSGQLSPPNANSRHVHELPSQTRVGHKDLHEM